ncbi:unnamed protein product [Ectocarpus sp. 6 AP-2014]
MLLAFGAHGKGINAPANATPDNQCCSALLVEDEAGSLDAFGQYRLPPPCGGELAVACPRLGFNSAAMNDGSMTPSWNAFRQQADLRLAPSCPRVEWEKRCRPGPPCSWRRRGGAGAARPAALRWAAS